jgi:hypothetical protein
MSDIDIERRLQAVERALRTRSAGPYFPSSTWTPTFTGLTVVGTPTYAGRITRIGHLAFVKVTITAGGANTTASTAVTTYIDNVPLTPAQPNVCYASSEAVANYGVGYVFASLTRIYTPTWAATNANITIAGWFEI